MSRRLMNWRILLALFVCARVTLAPALADARAGAARACSEPCLWRRRELFSAASIYDRAGRRLYRLVAVRAYGLRSGRHRGRIGPRHDPADPDHRPLDLLRDTPVPRPRPRAFRRRGEYALLATAFGGCCGGP